MNPISCGWDASLIHIRFFRLGLMVSPTISTIFLVWLSYLIRSITDNNTNSSCGVVTAFLCFLLLSLQSATQVHAVVPPIWRCPSHLDSSTAPPPLLTALLFTIQASITVGSGRLWSNGCQSQPRPHVHLRSEPDPGVRTKGRPMCWCRRGRNHCHQTPGKRDRKCFANFPRMGFLHYMFASAVQHCCTCILLFPQSATMMFPLTSTATPVGALNWPFPSPLEPNFNTNSPSGVKTWEKEKEYQNLSSCLLLLLRLNKMFLNVDLFTPVILDSVYSFISVTFSQYLDRVVVEVSHDDLIVLVHRCKVWTFRTRT